MMQCVGADLSCPGEVEGFFPTYFWVPLAHGIHKGCHYISAALLTTVYCTYIVTRTSHSFPLAYDTVHHGLIPATSNSSSIGTANPPIAVYLLVIAAFFSPDPLWATASTALFNVVAVLLAYIFTRRYYGRLAATIAALLYATAQTTVIFSRFIWQPTLLAPFTILFLFALFWGVVERRKGWLFPALVLLGVMYQLHELTLLREFGNRSVF